MKIGFIGCGNMAGAIIEGITANGIVPENDIYVYDISRKALEKMTQRRRVNICEDENDVVRKCEAVILAVKPDKVGKVLDKINSALEDFSTLIISIAAGKDIAYLRSNLWHDNRIIRVMPNINAKVGEAITAYTANAQATPEDRQLCEKLFSGIGKVLYLDEKHFPIFGVIGGCAPAFVFMFIDSLARAGVKYGLDRQTALNVAAQTVAGSAKTVLASTPEEHPWELVDKVCSPGGTTIEGVISLQSDGFEAAIENAVQKALEKDAKL